MSLTDIRLVPAFLLVLMLLTPATPAGANRKPSSLPEHHKALSTVARLGLYSARVRRSTASYLRLRLLELREEDLDRARAAIERRLSVDELLRGAGPATRPPGTPNP